MKLKHSRNTLTLGLLALAISVTCWSGELLENGDFARDLNYWRVNTNKGYGPSPQIKHSRGLLSFNRLIPVASTYLSMGTPVKVMKGKTYKFSYEIKGPAKGKYLVVIGKTSSKDKDTGKRIKAAYHCRNGGKTATVPDEWSTVELEFVGAYDTNPEWFKAARAAEKRNRLRDDRAGAPSDLKMKIRYDEHPCTTRLTFFLGTLEGKFAIRNISITEVE